MKKINLLLVSIFFSSCAEKELTIHNKSEKAIYSIISKNDLLGSSGYYWEYKKDLNGNYPEKNDTFKFHFEKIDPDSSRENHDRPLNWKEYFKRTKDNHVRVFIIEDDSVQKYGWRKIFSDTIYNKKYILSKKDLENQNWEIEYVN